MSLIRAGGRAAARAGRADAIQVGTRHLLMDGDNNEKSFAGSGSRPIERLWNDGAIDVWRVLFVVSLPPLPTAPTYCGCISSYRAVTPSLLAGRIPGIRQCSLSVIDYHESRQLGCISDMCDCHAMGVM